MDGVVNGRWMCELSNLTGKAYRIPRTYFKKCLDRDELRAPSIYFLFGEDTEQGKMVVYIGETEDALKRIGDHIQNSKKDYWTEVIVFISKDDNLNKAHIKYLESSFYEIASRVDRYIVMNTQPHKRSIISEPEEAEMKGFIENAKIIISALGHKAFEMLSPQNNNIVSLEETEDYDEYFYIRNSNGILAKGFLHTEGFVVCSGSKIKERDVSKSISKNLLKLLETYKNDGTIVDNIFTKNTLFSSPSSASTFILGINTNGITTWKNKNGVCIKEACKIKEVEI